MSFDIRSVRQISNDPLTKFTNQLAKKLSKFLNQNEVDKLENKEDVYSNGEDIDTVIRYPTFNSQKYFDFTTQYEAPFEPDLDKVKLWIKGTNLGNSLRDFSGFPRTVALKGDPVLVDGAPFDWGIHTSGIKSIALRFNRPTSDLENQEYIRITDNSGISVNGITTGVSYFIRFRVFSLSTQGSFTRTLVVKYDDANNGVLIQVTSDGRLIFIIKRAGTEYRVRTAASIITTNTVYEVWCTYANSGNVQHIYVNNSDKSLTDPGAPTWPTTTTDMLVMTRSISNGFVYGDFYDLTMYREKVVTAAQVGYHYTNKWSISDIAFGHVATTNYAATFPETPSVTSFTSTSFTSTSFTT
jgi:hypothetical protein